MPLIAQANGLGRNRGANRGRRLGGRLPGAFLAPSRTFGRQRGGGSLFLAFLAASLFATTLIGPRLRDAPLAKGGELWLKSGLDPLRVGACPLATTDLVVSGVVESESVSLATKERHSAADSSADLP